MKTTDIPFDVEELVSRVEGFAVGRESAWERKLLIPPLAALAVLSVSW